MSYSKETSPEILEDTLEKGHGDSFNNVFMALAIQRCIHNSVLLSGRRRSIVPSPFLRIVRYNYKPLSLLSKSPQSF